MIDKKIHLCWFGGGKFPVEVRECLESWKRLLPDYEIRVWGYDDAKAIGCRFIDEALEERKWAFAADVVRFYAVWKEGGVYMDSDIMLYKRFDDLMKEKGFVTVHEHIADRILLQAAFFMGEKGNRFCKECFDYYAERPFRLPDGTLDLTISPVVMRDAALRHGWKNEDVLQRLADDIAIFPGHLLVPNKRDRDLHPQTTLGRHMILHSWHKRKFNRRMEIAVKHAFTSLRYRLKRLFGNKIELPGD